MLSIRAYAKINLGLRILRKCEDGYHEIETVFHRVNIFDEIRLSPSIGISLTCTNPALPATDDNLCIRAATMFQEKYTVRNGVHVELTKTIPVGAGLGGGSSDAASTLLGLNQLWKLKLGNRELEPLALRIGSDVPYFLREQSAYATGRGEKLEDLDLDLPYWILIVYPNIHISTAWAYQHAHIPPARLNDFSRSGGHLTSHISLKEVLLENLDEPQRLITLLPNDFEPLILRTHPIVAQVKKQLYDLGAEFAQMTGSGSSVFGLFLEERDLKHAERELKKEFQVFVTEPHFKTGQIPNNK